VVLKNKTAHTHTHTQYQNYRAGKRAVNSLFSPHSRSTDLSNYYIKQSPSWEAKRSSASQEIPRILRNQNVHYPIHNSPPPVPILSEIDPVPHPTSRRSILISFHLRLGLPSGLPPSGVPSSTLYALLLSPIREIHRYRQPLLNYIPIYTTHWKGETWYTLECDGHSDLKPEQAKVIHYSLIMRWLYNIRNRGFWLVAHVPALRCFQIEWRMGNIQETQ
jgi:hypothetical protein